MTESFDLIIVGTGSGNSIPAALNSWKIALVEEGVFGGTCLNRGCIPSKMFVVAADVARTIEEGAPLGIHATLDRVDWLAIRERTFGRIDPIAAGGDRYRDHECENITVIRGRARFVGTKEIDVNGRRITAPQILLAAGARPTVPNIPGLDTVPFHTSDSIMRVDQVPAHLIIVGGGYIAAELGHCFGAFGAEVTFVLRSSQMLREQDDDISRAATAAYAERFHLITNLHGMRVEQFTDGRIVVHGDQHGEPATVIGDALLIATGRTPNGDRMDLQAGGITASGDGRRVLTDANLRTNVEGVWAIGDVTNTLQLKHLANAEAKIAFHNIAHHDKPNAWRAIDRSMVPYAVFSHPQIAAVGLKEREAQERGLPYVVATQQYGSTAYGWALEDQVSFVKVIAHRETRMLLGAHIVGPNAAILIQPLVQAMQFGQTVDQLAHDVWYIHPALTEVIENALLDL